MTKNHLPQLFEDLSGSAEFIEEYDELKKKKEECEERVRQLSVKIKEKKHEKIKVKGLAQYQHEIEECIKDQKDAQVMLEMARILLQEKQIVSLQDLIHRAESGIKSVFDRR